ncbi:hypothetical protein BV372_33110 [Nostoc sp. T09]|uniref:hypothetical protein n=1 Tax=Nostoc sp. T09 TaxID=1932621 RepID=UPI000A3D0BE8|nr:hypothetical protein [Nostoc sp. T09]OUL20333.1 hypothetical protein BV372_33110 [Nostoc sp. T09]
MFHASSAKPIDDSLSNIVEEIESQNPQLLVLAARQLRYSLHQTTVELTITEPRPFNVLEEFIIRAGIEFEPSPTANELASILGLDTVFVQSTIATLQKLQTLAQKSFITVTEQGRLFYEKGSVPQPPYAVQIYAITDSLGETVTFQAEPLNEVVINLPSLANILNISFKINEISSLSLEQIQTSLQASGVALHVPEAGKIVTAFRVIAPTQTIWRKISLFLIFDAKEDKICLQLRRGKQILNSRSKWLEILLSEGKLSLDAVCKSSNESINFEQEAVFKYKNSEIEARFEKLRKQALEVNTKQVIQLRDRQINQTFLETINRAKHQIIIYSPWVNQVLINDEFLNLLQQLAKRGVGILIGWGIAPRQEDEEPTILSEITEKLRAIKTPEGLPSVQVCWLGDSHLKELIVDRDIYLCGSYHWVDSGGYQIPTGESVYQVTIPYQVQEAYEFLANRFQNHAQQLWTKALENRDAQLAVEVLCIWGALGMEEIGVTEIEKNNWLELLPIWLNTVLPALRSNNLPDDLRSFKLALSLLSQVTGEEIFVDLLREGWRQVINAIAIHNRETALNLLNNEVWSQFLRLQIVSKNDAPDDFILQQNVPQPKKDEPGAKPKKGQIEKKTRRKVKE